MSLVASAIKPAKKKCVEQKITIPMQRQEGPSPALAAVALNGEAVLDQLRVGAGAARSSA